MSNHNKYAFLCHIILTVFFVSSSVAQQSDEHKRYLNKYKGENFVQTTCENIIHIDIKNNELVVKENHQTNDFFLTETAKYNSEQKIYTSDFFELNKIKARAFNYRDGKYKIKEVKDFREKDETGGPSFHDDLKSINFNYSGLSAGSKTYLNYEKTINNPRFLNSYYFGNFYPIEHYKLKIVAHKNIKLEFKKMNMDTLNVSFKTYEKNNKNIYEWELKNIDSYKNNNNAQPASYRLPHLIPIINYYHVKEDTTYVLNSTKDLYQWYASLITNVNKEKCDTDLKILVDSITKNSTTNLQKVTEIYYWTQKNIKYIAFEDGLGGFIPRNANDVFKKKYGDCKDNSSILKAMLEVANIKGYLTWIGTRDIPYKYEEVYSPVVDNHMILTYFEDEKPYFLDATGRYHSLYTPTSFIQGKQALVEVDSLNYKIVNVPILNETINKKIDSVDLHLDGTKLKGKGTVTYGGYEKINMFYSLERLRNEQDYKSFFKHQLQKGNNNFLIDSLTYTHKFNYDKDFSVAYFFELNKYVHHIKDEIYINMNLSQRDIAQLELTPPFENSVEYTHKYTGNYSFKFQIPKGYDIKSLPKNLTISNPLCHITIEYTVSNNTIYYTHDIQTKFLILTIDQQQQIYNLLETVRKKYSEIIVLKKQSK